MHAGFLFTNSLLTNLAALTHNRKINARFLQFISLKDHLKLPFQRANGKKIERVLD